MVGVGHGRPAGRRRWVVDDGPGIPPDQLAMVFERHFISDRVSGRRKGSGLGLAIVSELATAMGAAVRAESPVADGRGTRMVVWLATPSPADDPAPTAEPTSHRPSENHRIRRRRARRPPAGNELHHRPWECRWMT